MFSFMKMISTQACLPGMSHGSMLFCYKDKEDKFDCPRAKDQINSSRRLNSLSRLQRSLIFIVIIIITMIIIISIIVIITMIIIISIIIIIIFISIIITSIITTTSSSIIIITSNIIRISIRSIIIFISIFIVMIIVKIDIISIIIIPCLKFLSTPKPWSTPHSSPAQMMKCLIIFRRCVVSSCLILLHSFIIVRQNCDI